MEGLEWRDVGWRDGDGGMEIEACGMEGWRWRHVGWRDVDGEMGTERWGWRSEGWKDTGWGGRATKPMGCSATWQPLTCGVHARVGGSVQV